MHDVLTSIANLGDEDTRLITAENVYGRKGGGGMAELSETPQDDVAKIGQRAHPSAAARDLGRGWKVRPSIALPPGSITTILDLEGPGTIRHTWITTRKQSYRDLILRFYWDDESEPSVECPFGDFFCQGWNAYTPIEGLAMNVNPSMSNNCYLPMPFRRRARITVENRGPAEEPYFFYAITVGLGAVAPEAAYLHAQYRRSNPLPYATDHVILDGVTGRGHYVGTFMAWQQNSAGWWGEGEFKAFIDGDREFPTICGTGTEDYFGGAWCFNGNYSAPFLGYCNVTGAAQAGRKTNLVGDRHIMYRFHLLDPIRFRRELRVTMQALGWRSEKRHLPLQDDIHSVAYWYQTEPHGAFPALGSRDDLEII